MIPQLLLLILLYAIGQSAHRTRQISPEHARQYLATLVFIAVVLLLLYWGDFFDVLIHRIS
jgi:cadmium resistance protein CadD (predicted permease)